VPAVCAREHAKQAEGSGSALKCELVPMGEVAQVVDWLERNGVENAF
jgi:hypothetical protein